MFVITWTLIRSTCSCRNHPQTAARYRRTRTVGERFELDRRPIKAFTAILLCFCISAPAFSQSLGIPNESISVLTSGLNGLVKQVENSGHSLIDHGNAALGQQQVLMASTLAATISQFEKAYEGSLNTTFNSTDITLQNAYGELDKTVKAGAAIIHASVIDAQTLIYRTQGSANQLLDRLPFTKRTPVYYGFVTRDILASAHAAAADIEILGFYLVDSGLNFRKPEVIVSGEVIPAEQIEAQFDRVKIQLPANLRKKLKLENTACDPIKTFPVQIKVFYTNYPTLSRASSFFVKEAVFGGQGSPGAPVYDVTVDFNGTQNSTTLESHNFSTAGGYTSVGCEDTGAGTAQFSAPSNATEINGSAQWIETDKLKSQTQTVAITGLAATASGSIRGLDKGFMGSCDGGGHGKLYLSGTYKIPTALSTPANQSSNITIVSDGSVVTPSANGLKLTNLHVKISRRGCSDIFDETTFAIPDDPNRNVSQTTKKGFFGVAYTQSNVNITGTALLAEQ